MAPNPPRHGPRGFALLMAMLAVILLSCLAAGAILILGNEGRTLDTQDAAAKAATLAQSALRWFMNERSSTFGFTAAPPAASESTRVNYAGIGYADVLLTQIRPTVGNDLPIYLVRSHGVLTGGRLSGLPVAERTVAQYARYVRGTMAVQAGWLSLTGLTKNGGSGTLTGFDQCNASDPVAGVAVPTNPGYDQNGGQSVPTGDPPILDLGTQAQANASVHMDWDGIVSGTAITPTITIPPGSWPAWFPSHWWPVILVRQAGTFTLPGPGQGTIIVQNDMVISGSNMWRGIILVGGKLTSNGNNTVEGTVASGLNVLLGQTVEESDVGNGTKMYAYNSCNVASAMSAFASLKPLDNAWADNWGGY
jgi:hypothetical protein